MAAAVHGATTHDGELVEAALEGDQDAYAGLVERHEQAVRSTVRGQVGSPEAVEDAVQEAFTRGLAKLKTLRDPGRFRPWLLAIARNAATDARRDLNGVQLEPVDESGVDGVVVVHDEEGPDELAEVRELVSLVRGCVADLSARDATALAMVLWLGSGPTEVGDALDITPGAAKVLLHRARRRLADALILEVASTYVGHDCDEMRRLLGADWPASVARHVRDCGTCRDAGRRVLGVEPLAES
jgi:RNA polymerase sigma factor (sigma-70 family)